MGFANFPPWGVLDSAHARPLTTLVGGCAVKHGIMPVTFNVNTGDNIIIYGKRLVSDSFVDNEVIAEVIKGEVFARSQELSFQVENYHYLYRFVSFVFS